MIREDLPVRSILMLPDDIVLNCLARVSRSYYPTLSLVSKRFHSLLTSPELYQIRTLLGYIETGPYVCLRSSTKSLHWYILSQTPHSTTKILVPVPSPNWPTDFKLDVALIAPNSYAISGLRNYNASSNVLLMDYSSNQRCEAPRIQQVARVSPSACIDQNTYIMRGCKKHDPKNRIVIYDTNIVDWEVFEISRKQLRGDSKYKRIRYERIMYTKSPSKDDTIKLYKGIWRRKDIKGIKRSGKSSSDCVIGNVFYRRPRRGTVEWYDPNKRLWQNLKGLNGLEELPRNVKLANYGGKMAVLWEECVLVGNLQENTIWCKVIALHKDQHMEICGTLEWFGKVFTSNEPYGLVHAFSAEGF
ncbi:hypothetical protein CARUB_v10021417mg [Capsella rubella]|uniref:F-box domain-containing protein n=1 Tax=Capsella rubella TaxID=81985 RepID=R0HVR7_9BRAS|nr:F-box/kelch-repeat protein At4g23580 [Capsella rubella]EOA33924.1 hypothetical protein CARUB_v10021417mg [Capsella rubella]